MYKMPDDLRGGLPSSQAAVPLSQGDIIDCCPLVFWADHARLVVEGNTPLSTRARVIILTQACDMANHKTGRAIVAVVHKASHLVQTGRVSERLIRDNVRRGQVYGWYFLPVHESCPPFPESLVNLTDLHTVPRTLLEDLRDQGNHVCQLITPYREHLAQHFAVTYSRIGLPEAYETQR